ncbi:hypothetical protein V1517DRAFT_353139 [Lipomyces orientalis]|uniref:Uncharacterized protein n=1 Tax=Lipomyces orientalis TaxID=1233043 RepID=A0ACC3TMV7_9ASCO
MGICCQWLGCLTEKAYLFLSASYTPVLGILGKHIGPMGLGLMGFTYRPESIPDQQAFNWHDFFSGREFFGPYLEYPEHAGKVVIPIKGGFNSDKAMPGGSPELARAAKKTFRVRRVDSKVPINTTVSTVAELLREGLIGGMPLCEVKSETIRRAAQYPCLAYSPLGRGL